MFKAKEKLRKSVYNALKRLSQNKTCDTQKLLGCTWIEAKQHFEKLFTEGMNWNNQGVKICLTTQSGQPVEFIYQGVR